MREHGFRDEVVRIPVFPVWVEGVRRRGDIHAELLERPYPAIQREQRHSDLVFGGAQEVRKHVALGGLAA